MLLVPQTAAASSKVLFVVLRFFCPFLSLLVVLRFFCHVLRGGHDTSSFFFFLIHLFLLSVFRFSLLSTHLFFYRPVAFVRRTCRIEYYDRSLLCLLCLLHYNVVSLCRGFVTHEGLSLSSRKNRHGHCCTGCAGWSTGGKNGLLWRTHTCTAFFSPTQQRDQDIISRYRVLVELSFTLTRGQSLTRTVFLLVYCVDEEDSPQTWLIGLG